MAVSRRKFHSLQNALDIFVFHPEPATAVQTDGHEEGRETVGLEAVQGDVLAEGDPGFDGDPHLFDHLDFALDNISRQAVFGDPHGHHSAGYRQFFKDCHLVAVFGKVIGRRQSCRSGSHDGDLFLARRGSLGDKHFALVQFPVG